MGHIRQLAFVGTMSYESLMAFIAVANTNHQSMSLESLIAFHR
jgi:hypothetical protein